MIISGALGSCSLGVVCRSGDRFGEAADVALLCGLLGCRRLREVWRSWVRVCVVRRSSVSKAWG